MSFNAIRMAFAIPVESSAERLVLLAYANHCGHDNLCAWPSRNRLRELTLLDLKTISLTVKRLIRRGLLVDTGERKGTTGRVPVYRLCDANVSENGTIQSTQERNGLVLGIDPKCPSNTSENGSLNEPKNGIRNGVLNQSGKREIEARTPNAAQCLSSDWKPDPETEEWIKQVRSDIDIEMTVAKFVIHAIAKGWIKTDWNSALKKWVLNERSGPRTDILAIAPTQAAHSLNRAQQTIAEGRAARRGMVREIPDHLRKFIPRGKPS